MWHNRKAVWTAWAFLLTVAILVAALPGCSSGSSGTVVRYDIDGPVTNLDPQFATSPTAHIIISNIYEGLLVATPEGEFLPGVASSYEVSSDGLTYVFSLREAYWGDEQKSPVTAQDFVFAFQRMFQKSARSPYAEDYCSIRGARGMMEEGLPADTLGVTAKDERSLEIRLEQPDPLFLYKLTEPAAMPCNQVFFERTGGRYGLQGNLLTNGPFGLVTWDNEKYILLRPNANYLSESPVLAGGVNLYIGRGDSAEQFLSGNSDLAALSLSQYDRLGRTGTRDIAYDTRVWCLVFDQNDPVWGNALLRQALFHTIDYTELEEALPNGLTATSQLVPPAARLGIANYRDLVGLVEPVGYETDRAEYLYELALSTLELDSLPATVLHLPDSGGHSMYMGTLQKGWQRYLSAFINLEQHPMEDLNTLYQTGSYQVLLIPFSSGDSRVETVLGVFSTKSGQNDIGYHNPFYDQLLEEAAEQTTLRGIAEGYARAEYQILSDAVVIPVYAETTYFATTQGLSGVEVFPAGSRILFKNAHRE